ncbi:hypothetical protein PF005_g29045 [Phytophthora fragariae]|uniref:Uncharacterized protein n=1 Tax=Phytophthora fragariae TaxID=53985 RepID=A0A6A3S9Q8_9STRA|nr:hypothetical protein PF003_g23557 [Phytophthora fragariae]KAE8942587.1 hypothetical protein PF009_g7658 [Phytophthora fragariae]KAE9065274.1 hypothetical protein PF007_g28897 [Phytophthora fragariae]KAE9112589.1 hypothetical protein PF006_g19949 [Phytophthora fragariae]KAE9166807.1 hypothetical protein PF005_g29045 [Phytophthora fragariae]
MGALVEKVPQQIRDDLDKLYERASQLNVSLYELAYPWKESRLFYDPHYTPTFTSATGDGGASIDPISGIGSCMLR